MSRSAHVMLQAAMLGLFTFAAGCMGSGEITEQAAFVTEGLQPDLGGVPEAEEGEMTPALRQAFIAARMAEAGPEHAFRALDQSSFVAVHPQQMVAFELGPRGLTVSSIESRGESWQAELSLSGLGREGEIVPVGLALPEAEANRVEYRRSGVTEWYVHGPMGLEQGFALTERPPGVGRLALEVAVNGLLPALSGGGDLVMLRDDGGVVQLTYSNLFVVDAREQEVPARLVVGAERIVIEVDDREATYPLEVDPVIASQEARLTASDGAAGDNFGWSVSLDGDQVLVGACEDDSLRGSAYVFVRGPSGWSQEAKLVAEDGEEGDRFGCAVSLDGNRALIGAVGHELSRGSAYVFVHETDGWIEETELFAEDGEAGDNFGWSVSLDGDRALIGTWVDDLGRGSAYLFLREEGVWTQEGKLVAFDGENLDWFGYSVSLDGDRALVGAYGDDENGEEAGAAYVFVHEDGDWNGGWVEETKLTATDGEVGDRFGSSVSLSGDRVLIGAPEDGIGLGAAYVFVRSAADWTQEAKLTASDGVDWFGSSVSLSGDRALIGTGEGIVAYVFVRRADDWTLEASLTASDWEAEDGFGFSLSLDGNRALVGARGGNVLGEDSGSAYVFGLHLTDGSPCPGPFDCASGFCVDGVCCESACGGGSTTDCMTCSLSAGGMYEGICGPLSALVAPTVTCRATAGDCDVAEICSSRSTSCPVDSFVEHDTECRASVGVCDVAETCTGVSAFCPPNAYHSTGYECRASAGPCDVTEVSHRQHCVK